MGKIDGIKFVENVETLNRKISTASELIVSLEDMITTQNDNFKDIVETKLEIITLRDNLVKEVNTLEQELVKNLISNQKQIKNLTDLFTEEISDLNKKNESIIKKNNEDLLAISKSIEQRIIIQRTKIEELEIKVKTNKITGLILSSLIIILLIVIIVIIAFINYKIS